MSICKVCATDVYPLSTVEEIEAPRCCEISKQLDKYLSEFGIPVHLYKVTLYVVVNDETGLKLMATYTHMTTNVEIYVDNISVNPENKVTNCGMRLKANEVRLL